MHSLRRHVRQYSPLVGPLGHESDIDDATAKEGARYYLDVSADAFLVVGCPWPLRRCQRRREFVGKITSYFLRVSVERSAASWW
jgi:hypothetical protein